GFYFTETRLLAQRHDADGNAVGARVEMPVKEFLFDAIPLSGGRYAVVFVVATDLVLQQFAADGTALTEPEVIWNDMEGNRFSSSLTLDDGDRLIVTHEDELRVVDVAALTRLGDGDDNRTLTEAERVHGEGGDDTLTGSEEEDALLGGVGADLLAGAGADDRVDGGTGDDTVSGGNGSDLLIGGDDADLLRGEDGNDTMIGGFGNDLMSGGTGDDLMMGDDTFLFSENLRGQPDIGNDLSDTILGGDGNDTVGGGAGNDLAYGGIGDDSLDGGLGADTLTGQDGNDSLTGGALGDLLFGGEGDDFLNGGSGYDRLNGGTGADRFFHGTVPVHGTDWVQDYDAAEGDVLLSTREEATADWFQVNLARTPGAGDGQTDEAFVIFRPTGQILWALVDGGAQESINIQLEGGVFDLLT
ncbi:calcium-binding protein, partial [Cribrihabitans sp. XS_ASV171]